MPSPFPGMDPWLEAEGIFPDLHDTLLLLMKEALNAALPPGYRATTRNRVWVDEGQRRDPDVSLFGPDDHGAGNGTALATLSGLAVVNDFTDPWEEMYLEIVSQEGDRLVTAIEVLSRSNKRPGSRGREAYAEKQEEYRRGGVNVVEIDLLRSGVHATMIDAQQLDALTPGYSYHVCVTICRPPRRRFAAAWRMADRLPAFDIPLDPGVRPVHVDLQPMLDRTYDISRYAMAAKYRRPPDPPLTPEQQAWAEGILREKGLLA
jgi:hypothetical protein